MHKATLELEQFRVIAINLRIGRKVVITTW